MELSEKAVEQNTNSRFILHFSAESGPAAGAMALRQSPKVPLINVTRTGVVDEVLIDLFSVVKLREPSTCAADLLLQDLFSIQLSHSVHAPWVQLSDRLFIEIHNSPKPIIYCHHLPPSFSLCLATLWKPVFQSWHDCGVGESVRTGFLIFVCVQISDMFSHQNGQGIPCFWTCILEDRINLAL